MLNAARSTSRTPGLIFLRTAIDSRADETELAILVEEGITPRRAVLAFHPDLMADERICNTEFTFLIEEALVSSGDTSCTFLSFCLVTIAFLVLRLTVFVESAIFSLEASFVASSATSSTAEQFVREASGFLAALVAAIGARWARGVEETNGPPRNYGAYESRVATFLTR